MVPAATPAADGTSMAAASSSTVARFVIAPVTFGPRPRPSAERIACRNDSAFCSAKLASAVSVAGPMPRFGVFRMRRSASSSSGFATAMRYAIASLISARS